MMLRLVRTPSLLAASCAALLALWSAAVSGQTAPPIMAKASVEDPSGARVIVKYKALGSMMRALRASGAPAKGPQYAATLGGRSGLSLSDGRVIDTRSQVVRGGKGISSAALAARLAADPEVEYAVPDLRRRALAAPNDPLYAASVAISPAAGQWYLRAPDATFISPINAEGAWSLTTGSPSIVVADLDTGVRFDHPDLASKLYAGYDFVSSGSKAGDGGGRDGDASDPGDWTDADECGPGEAAKDSSWHGTQTSGLIGAQTGNGLGMASVGYNVMLLPVRVLGKCGGFDSDIIAGMLWAGGVSTNPVVNTHPARVLNMSLGGSGSCHAAYADAVSQLAAAGVVVVAAAGNATGLAVGTPANCSGVIAVAGVRHVGTKVGFSSIGPEVAIAAPAGNCVNTSGPCLYPILTATNTGTTTPATNTYSDSSKFSVGTSFATPLVAGAAALMLSVNPSLTPAQLKDLLMRNARPFPTTSSDPTVVACRPPDPVPQIECICTTSTCGAGLLDVAAAVGAAATGAVPVAVISASASVVVAGASVTFNGGSSSAGGGRSISAYRWSLVSGSAIASFSGSTSGASATVLTSGLGNFTVQLTVTDSTGQQASSTASVVVNPPIGPSATLLASASVVSAGSVLAFDGRSSTAAAGLTIVGYQWRITSGAALATFTSGTSDATATVVTAAAGSGSFTIQLTVTDSLGQQASATRSISVTALGPTASISAPSLTVTVGSSTRFDGSSSLAPAGRRISSYQWAITAGGSIASFSGINSAPTATINTSAAGSFTLQLTVTDNAGVQDSKSVTISVAGSDFDRVANWAELAYAPYFPKPGVAGVYQRYTYRYYAATGNYLGTDGTRVIVHNGRDWNLLDVGALADFLTLAKAAGF